MGHNLVVYPSSILYSEDNISFELKKQKSNIKNWMMMKQLTVPWSPSQSSLQLLSRHVSIFPTSSCLLWISLHVHWKPLQSFLSDASHQRGLHHGRLEKLLSCTLESFGAHPNTMLRRHSLMREWWVQTWTLQWLRWVPLISLSPSQDHDHPYMLWSPFSLVKQKDCEWNLCVCHHPWNSRKHGWTITFLRLGWKKIPLNYPCSDADSGNTAKQVFLFLCVCVCMK